MGLLGMKQASTPISNALIKKARSNKFIRRYVLMPMGWAMYRVQVWVNMKELGMTGKITKKSKFVEEEMVAMGSKILAEVIIFGIIGTFIVFTFHQNKEETSNDDTEDEELEQLKSKLLELEKSVDAQHETIEQLDASLKMLLRCTKADT